MKKKTAGRPQKYGEKTKHYSIRVPLTLMKRFAAHAKKRKTTVSGLIVDLMKDEIQQEKK